MDLYTYSLVRDAAVLSCALLFGQFAHGPAAMAQDIVYPSSFQITKDVTAVLLEDYATLPLSGRGGSISDFGPHVDLNDQLSRPNFLRSEPADAPLSSSRLFVCDLNRHLYILDKSTKSFTPYLNFQAVFPRFFNHGGYAGGLVTFAFDSAYASNGVFYTVHVETPGSGATPIDVNVPGLDLEGYSITSAINAPAGSISHIDVLVEWTDTNINNTTFEGTAREILRTGQNSRIHPMGDLLFNPLAQPGDSDYRNLYIAIGDGAAGEKNNSQHETPQRLDALQGKILRITPDLNLRPADQLSANGRYRIPTTGQDPNPFTSGSVTNLPNLKKEIYAYGFRNCHRISWDPVTNLILENDIGQHSWEEVNIVHKGLNYGYGEREGAEQMFVNVSPQVTGSQLNPVVPFPSPDQLSVAGLGSPITPTYPVALYSHWDGEGISSGFVYRGSLMPHMRGKYIFGDIPNGRLFYCDLDELIAADDGDRNTVAEIHELQMVFENVERRMFDLIADEFDNRGGSVFGKVLPGRSDITDGNPPFDGNDPEGVPYGGGRADIRLAVGGDDEMYVISKSDGTIRLMSAVLLPPTITSVTATNGTVTLTWPAVIDQTYRIQHKGSALDPDWTDLPGDVTATSSTASKSDSTAEAQRLYRLILP